MPYVVANGVRLHLQVEGSQEHPVVLLIMGVGAPLTRWPQALVDDLVRRGFRVIRFDNRDCGRSQDMTGAPQPDAGAVSDALASGARPPMAYTVTDMAADAIGLLDGLGLARAHVVGASMGGMIAQEMAAGWPDRVLSLVSIMSTPGAADLPRATARVQALVSGTVAASPRDSLLISAEAGRSPGYPTSPAQIGARVEAELAYGFNAAGRQRQIAAVYGAGDRSARLRAIQAPTVVIHGDGDELFPLEHGERTAQLIPGAVLKIIPGMGHDLPDALCGELAALIAEAAARA